MLRLSVLLASSSAFVAAPAVAQPAGTEESETDQSAVEPEERTIPEATPVPAEPVPKRDVPEEDPNSSIISAYGVLRVYSAVTGDDVTIENGASWVGWNLRWPLSSTVRAVSGSELALNLVENDNRFTLSAATESNFVVQEVPNTGPFGTRLGYLGLNTDWGEITMGKQWSVYYDVAGWTDWYHVFGGRALGIYTGNTDGGENGTGRAEQAIMYRHSLHDLSIGLQVQLQSAFSDVEFDGTGGSLYYEAGRFAFGIAGNYALYPEGLAEAVPNVDRASAVAVGIRYNSPRFDAALVGARTYENDAVFFEDETVIFSADGLEGYSRLHLRDSVHLVAGFNYQRDNDSPQRVAGFEWLELFAGVSYRPTPGSWFFIEGQHQFGNFPGGTQLPTVITFGALYRFKVTALLDQQ